MEFLQTLLVFAVAGFITLLFLPLWPFGIGAFLAWQMTPPAPDLDSAVA